MYNLLVTADETAWEDTEYIFDRSRFLEYTNDEIYKQFEKLTTENIERLKSFPCLFAYEGIDSKVYIGFITLIKDYNNGKSIYIEYNIDKNYIFTFKDFNHIINFLDIREWEIRRTHWAIKNDDLIKRLIGVNLINSKIKKPISMNKNINYEDSSFENIKISEKNATSIRGFIDKVLNNEKNNEAEIFYRGHSDKEKYKLAPSLLRRDEEGNYLYLDNEDILYRELISFNPKDFSEEQYTVDKLMRMQHYSLPTRLLDITSNPLIALYFACKSNISTKGEVVIFKINKPIIKYFDSDTASCIANLARLPKHEKKDIDFNLFKDEFNKQMPIKRLLHFIREEKSFFNAEIIPSDLKRIICIKGKKSNDRVSSQSGAFLLFGLDSTFNEMGMEDIEILRVSITNKKKILQELDQLNINESTVFPYIENSAKYVANKFKFNNELQN